MRVQQEFVFRSCTQIGALNQLGVCRENGDHYRNAMGAVTAPTHCGHRIWFAHVGRESVLARNFAGGHYFVNYVENNESLVELCIGTDANAFWSREHRVGEPALSVILRHCNNRGEVIRQTYFGAVVLEAEAVEARLHRDLFYRLHLYEIPEEFRHDIQVMSRRWRVVRTAEDIGEN